jgi:hypothetical protein
MLNLSGMPLDQNHMGTQARLNRMRRNAKKAKQLKEDVEAWKATPVADKRKAFASSRGMGSRNVLAKKGGKRRRTRKLRKSRRKNRRKSRRKSRKSNRRRTRRRRHRR